MAGSHDLVDDRMLDPVRLDEIAIPSGTPLTEREVILDGIGRTFQVCAAARHVPPGAGPAVQGITAVAIPYFQWDNRGPGAMRVWVPLS